MLWNKSRTISPNEYHHSVRSKALNWGPDWRVLRPKYTKEAKFLLLLRFTYGIRTENNLPYFPFRLIYEMTKNFCSLISKIDTTKKYSLSSSSCALLYFLFVRTSLVWILFWLHLRCQKMTLLCILFDSVKRDMTYGAGDWYRWGAWPDTT